MYLPGASAMPGSSTGPLKVKKVRSSAVCAEAGAFPSPASSVPAQTSPQILLPTLLLSMESSFRPCERCHIAASSIQTRLTLDKFPWSRNGSSYEGADVVQGHGD